VRIDVYNRKFRKTLKQVFDEHAEETITEEQLQRVLAPVERMINAGCFNSEPKRRSLCWILTPQSRRNNARNDRQPGVSHEK